MSSFLKKKENLPKKKIPVINGKMSYEKNPQIKKLNELKIIGLFFIEKIKNIKLKTRK